MFVLGVACHALAAFTRLVWSATDNFTVIRDLRVALVLFRCLVWEGPVLGYAVGLRLMGVYCFFC